METPTPSDAKSVTDTPEPQTFREWLIANSVILLVMLGLLALVIIRFNIFAVIKMAIGLGLVIFIHELGHFLAAKWCDVHVKTFSIGFGPALPGCRFRYGETTYMIGQIPLGGYVSMVGEGDASDKESDQEEAEEDPRSFRNKSVYQRMLIISAGVIMNVLLAAVCFIAAYSHGIEELPGAVGKVESGSAAWEAGIRTNVEVTQLDDRKDPWFKAITAIARTSDEDEKLTLVTRSPREPNARQTYQIEPTLQANALYPSLGIGPASSLTLIRTPDNSLEPVDFNSAAARAEPPLAPGDRIIACTDPDDPTQITDLPAASSDTLGVLRDNYAFHRRMMDLQGQPVTLKVRRVNRETPVTIQVPAAFHHRFGLRMQMGKIRGVQVDSPAQKAIPIRIDDQPVPEGESPTPVGIQAMPPEGNTDTDHQGDKLIAVEVAQPDGSTLRFVSSPSSEVPEGVTEKLLDPVQLPDQLAAWAKDQTNDRQVLLTVLRPINHKEARVTLVTEWNDARRYDDIDLFRPNSPLPINGLGLAYQIETIVDAVQPGSPAEANDIRPGDVIKAIQPYRYDSKGELKEQKWIELEPDHWAFVMGLYPRLAPTMGFKIERNQEQTIELKLTAKPDPTWPLVDRGFRFEYFRQMHIADGMLDAISIGVDETTWVILSIYKVLRGLVTLRISVETLRGPLTIGSFAYSIAKEDLYQFLAFLGLISANLAVINFLPIPVLDGGHMVFLIYEMIRGKPAPERVQTVALIMGLVIILSFMAYVIFKDVQNLFF